MRGKIALKVEGAVLALKESPDPGIGEPVKVVASNTGETDLHAVSVSIVGQGRGHVEVSLDRGDWSPAVVLKTLEKGKSQDFWVRAVYDLEDANERLSFELVASSLSLG